MQNTEKRSPLDGILLWLAQGFGVGRIPFAPGTFGSLVGLLWFVLLLKSGNFWVYLLGTVAGIFLSVWLCGVGEKVLKQKDPGSVVMDEIIALPVCFLGWIITLYLMWGRMPGPNFFFSAANWPYSAAVFVLFRLFDIAKPWPVRQSQTLPGGWGVTIDDVLAAGYVNIAITSILIAQSLMAHRG